MPVRSDNLPAIVNTDSPSAVREARDTAVCLGLAFLAAVVLFVSAYALRPAEWDVVATTPAGDAYVIGSGSDCRSAWREVVIPAGWTRIACEPRL